MRKNYRLAAIALLVCSALLLMGCPPKPGESLIKKGFASDFDGSRLQAAHFNDPLKAIATDGPVELWAARNETVQFAVQVNKVPLDSKKGSGAFRIGPLRSTDASLAPDVMNAFQVLPMPFDDNRAGFVRHTGLPVSTHELPRALLPMPLNKGELPVNAMRSPADPTNPQSRAGGAAFVLLWVDVAIPPTAKPGSYEARCELMEDGQVVSTLPVKLTVYDFVLPDERHLTMVGRVKWQSLCDLYPAQFEAVTPNLISRADPQYSNTVRTLDQIVKLAQAHRAIATFERLQPTVKWPGNKPQIDWTDYDALVSPWLNGDAFPDNVALGFWPLPKDHLLDKYAPAQQKAFWTATAARFNQMNWLSRSAAAIEKTGKGPVKPVEALLMSKDAAMVLASHPKLRVSVPLEADQVQIASANNNAGVDAGDLERLMPAAQGLIKSPAQGAPPMGPAWLRTDVPGLIPYVGAGADERESRLWAWLAFLRGARLIHWDSPLPTHTDPSSPADPDEMVWFYPGAWFGVNSPVPTVQLKWLRRAEQDYEYLWIARERRQFTHELVMANVLTKPVDIQPNQDPDPSYALMCGTSDAQRWSEAIKLLARLIQMSEPGANAEKTEDPVVLMELSNWIKSQDKPTLLGRSTLWGFGLAKGPGQNVVDLRLSVDIYNATDQLPNKNSLQWTGVPEGWQIPKAEPVSIPELRTYAVRSFDLEAKILLNRLNETMRDKPVDITFTNGYDGRTTLTRLMLPVAPCDKREVVAPKVDGSLEEWTAADALCDGKMIQMLNRPAVQRQELQFASTSSQLYSCWTNSAFYVGFRLEGVEATRTVGGGNVVREEMRRGWGEDLTELLIQPVYADGDPGPVIHMTCRPAGQMEASKQLDRRKNANPNAAVPAVNYAATLHEEMVTRTGKQKKENIWRGEVKIPWDSMSDPADEKHANQRPALLRFNFAQHRNATGESASWAGPIDFGGDEGFTGLLVVR